MPGATIPGPFARWRRQIPCLAVTLAIVFPGVAIAGNAVVHTRLLSSSPAADEILEAPPERLELRFSGPVNYRLSSLIVVLETGESLDLEVALGSGDESVLVARPPRLPAGRHMVRWKTVSADGHPVEGEFTFSVSGEATDEVVKDPSRTVPAAPGDLQAIGQESAGAPGRTAFREEGPAFTSSLLAGVGLACVLGFAGLLWFVGAGPLLEHQGIRWTITGLGGAAAFLLSADLAAWLAAVTPPGSGVGGVWSGLVSRTGLAASARVLLVLSALVLQLTRGRTAAVIALVAVLLGSLTGHPAAIVPAAAIAANALHLSGAAIWLGGLLLLGLAPNGGAADGPAGWRFEDVATSVSAAALLAVILITASGILQSILFVGDLSLYLNSQYGRVVLLKAAGLVVLIGFGAYHRRRTLPALAGNGPDDGGDGGASLRRTARIETIVMLAVILIAAHLGRISPPSAP